MDIAALIISILALICSAACLIIMLAKNFFSTHIIQTQMVDPFKEMMGSEIGRPQMDPFQDFDAMDEDDIERIKEMAKKRKQV